VAVDIVGPQTQALPNAIPRCQHLRTRDLADHIAGPPAMRPSTATPTSPPCSVVSERFVQVVVGGDARAGRVLAGTSWIDTPSRSCEGTTPRTDRQSIPR
jgi:hypothetical protein